MGPGDDVGGDEFTEIADGAFPGADGGFDGGNVAGDHDGDIGGTDFLFADELDIRRLPYPTASSMCPKCLRCHRRATGCVSACILINW